MAASDVVRNAARLVALHGEAMTLKREGEASTVILMFFTNDGGTTWFGTVMGQSF